MCHLWITRPSLALAHVREHGACIFQCDIDGFSDGQVRDRVELLAREIFASSLDMAKDPVPAPHPKDSKPGARFRKGDGSGKDGKYNVHNDGWNVYGELSPDYFILFCSQPATPDGEGDSWILDGYQILEAMSTESREAMFAQSMMSRDPTTRQISPLHGGDMWVAEWQAPIAQLVPGSERVLCRMAGRDLDVPTSNQASAAIHNEWNETAQRLADITPRFKLQRGQALVMDNYRMFHGRDDYFDPARRMWRVWCWTDGRLFKTLPVNCRCMCGPEYGGSPNEAGCQCNANVLDIVRGERARRQMIMY
jgi:hypothetical protein